MTQIIREQKEISGASTAVLIATYNALTGKNIKKFYSRAAGESQVSNAILGAKDAAGKLGVPKGTNGSTLTAKELAAAKSGAGSKPEAAKAEAPKAKAPGKPSLRAKLAAKAGTAEPNKGKPKVVRKATEDGSRAPRLLAVTFSANPSGARLNTGSIRSEIAAWMNKRIERAKEKGEEKPEQVSVDDVIKKFGPQGRQALQKMIMLGHLDAIRAERAAE